MPCGWPGWPRRRRRRGAAGDPGASLAAAQEGWRCSAETCWSTPATASGAAPTGTGSRRCGWACSRTAMAARVELGAGGEVIAELEWLVERVSAARGPVGRADHGALPGRPAGRRAGGVRAGAAAAGRRARRRSGPGAADAAAAGPAAQRRAGLRRPRRRHRPGPGWQPARPVHSPSSDAPRTSRPSLGSWPSTGW